MTFVTLFSPIPSLWTCNYIETVQNMKHDLLLVGDNAMLF